MKRDVILIAFVAAAIASIAFTGCEVESVDDRIVITPQSARIYKWHSIKFTAHGGFEYTWSLEEPDWGIIENRTGDRTIYTSIYNPPSNAVETAKDIIQVLRVTSRVPGRQATTNGTPDRWTAEAYIYHMRKPEDVDDD